MSKARWHPPQRLKRPIRSALGSVGFELVRLKRPDTAFLQHTLSRHNVNVLLDVGANRGQYAARMRTLGYTGEIVSFEPGRQAYKALVSSAASDPLWTTMNVALGARRTDGELIVSKDSLSSSLLQVAAPHVAAAPASVADHVEQIRVELLDEQPLSNRIGGQRIWLKLDTQGYELEVLLGAPKTLEHVRVVQTELSMLPCYQEQADYREILNLLHTAGFQLTFVEPGTQDPKTGQMLQFDAVFERHE